MGSEWKAISAAEFCASVRDGTHDSPKQVAEGHYLITSRHITGNSVELENAYKISVEDFKAINKRSKVDRWDVLITMIGTVGEPCLVKNEPGFAIKNIGLFKSKGELEGKWLYYYLLSPAAQHLIRTYSRGSTQQYIPLGALREFPVMVPSDRREMEAIAQILGSLDDKIELNRKMNETLEAMAQAIFKSWFVDFDPVRAKAEGRNPGLPKEIAELFPDSFEDSELGQIPKGWEIKTIGEAVQCVGGSTPSTKNPEFWNGGTNPFVTPKDMSSLSSPVLLETTRHISDAGVEKISSGRLPTGTVLLSSRAPIGYLAITEVPVSINQGIIAMICDKELPNYYVLYWTEANMDTIKSNAGGTTFAEISKSNFRPIQVIVPHKYVLEAYVQQVEPLYQQLVLNLQESNSIASLRDILLPQLISGELRVPNAEEIFKNATI